jgi:hypothetical protein
VVNWFVNVPYDSSNWLKQDLAELCTTYATSRVQHFVTDHDAMYVADEHATCHHHADSTEKTTQVVELATTSCY